jgi:hypothetical protein
VQIDPPKTERQSAENGSHFANRFVNNNTSILPPMLRKGGMIGLRILAEP